MLTLGKGLGIMIDEVHKCEVCNKPVPDYKPNYCCNAFDCACQGEPEYPCICSNRCFDIDMGIDHHDEDCSDD